MALVVGSGGESLTIESRGSRLGFIGLWGVDLGGTGGAMERRHLGQVEKLEL